MLRIVLGALALVFWRYPGCCWSFRRFGRDTCGWYGRN